MAGLFAGLKEYFLPQQKLTSFNKHSTKWVNLIVRRCEGKVGTLDSFNFNENTCMYIKYFLQGLSHTCYELHYFFYYWVGVNTKFKIWQRTSDRYIHKSKSSHLQRVNMFLISSESDKIHLLNNSILSTCISFLIPSSSKKIVWLGTTKWRNHSRIKDLCFPVTLAFCGMLYQHTPALLLPVYESEVALEVL